MLGKVRQFIKEQNLLQAGDSVVLGLSGGADSVVLLLLLCELREEWQLTLTAVHINHGIRGVEAERDERYVKELCDRVIVPLKVYHYNVPEIAAREHLTEEEAGRMVRYEAFEQVRERIGASVIATAHHQNDNAETLLFHAFRGSGMRGLTGIPSKRGNIVRPLLCVSREEIETYLTDKGVNWCTDCTNAQNEYSRNRIRNIVLPEAEKINGGAVKHLAALSQEMAEIADYLETEAGRLLEKACCGRRAEEESDARGANQQTALALNIESLRGVPGIMLREVLFQAFTEVAGSRKDIGREHIIQIAELMEKQSGRSLNLPYGITVRREFGRLIFEKESQEDKCNKVDVNSCAPEIVKNFPFERDFGDYVLRLDLISYEKNMPIPKSDYEKWYNYDKMKSALCVRNRMPGDYLVINKDGGRKTLKSLMIERKISAAERDSTVILAMENRVLWATGIRSDEGFHITEDTKSILRAVWKRIS